MNQYKHALRELGLTDPKVVDALSPLVDAYYNATARLHRALASHGGTAHSVISRSSSPSHDPSSVEVVWVRVFDKLGIYDLDDSFTAPVSDALFRYAWRHHRANCLVARLASSRPAGALPTQQPANEDAEVPLSGPSSSLWLAGPRPAVVLPNDASVTALRTFIGVLDKANNPAACARKLAAVALMALYKHIFAAVYRGSKEKDAADAGGRDAVGGFNGAAPGSTFKSTGEASEATSAVAGEGALNVDRFPPSSAVGDGGGSAAVRPSVLGDGSSDAVHTAAALFRRAQDQHASPVASPSGGASVAVDVGAGGPNSARDSSADDATRTARPGSLAELILDGASSRSPTSADGAVADKEGDHALRTAAGAAHGKLSSSGAIERAADEGAGPAGRQSSAGAVVGAAERGAGLASGQPLSVGAAAAAAEGGATPAGASQPGATTATAQQASRTGSPGAPPSPSSPSGVSTGTPSSVSSAQPPFSQSGRLAAQLPYGPAALRGAERTATQQARTSQVRSSSRPPRTGRESSAASATKMDELMSHFKCKWWTSFKSSSGRKVPAPAGTVANQEGKLSVTVFRSAWVQVVDVTAIKGDLAETGFSSSPVYGLSNMTDTVNVLNITNLYKKPLQGVLAMLLLVCTSEKEFPGILQDILSNNVAEVLPQGRSPLVAGVAQLGRNTRDETEIGAAAPSPQRNVRVNPVEFSQDTGAGDPPPPTTHAGSGAGADETADPAAREAARGASAEPAVGDGGDVATQPAACGGGEAVGDQAGRRAGRGAPAALAARGGGDVATQLAARCGSDAPGARAAQGAGRGAAGEPPAGVRSEKNALLTARREGEAAADAAGRRSGRGATAHSAAGGGCGNMAADAAGSAGGSGRAAARIGSSGGGETTASRGDPVGSSDYNASRNPATDAAYYFQNIPATTLARRQRALKRREARSKASRDPRPSKKRRASNDIRD